MKKQLKKSVSLKKLTVARINDYGMTKIKGGDCLATDHCNSHMECESTQHRY
ncbi:class I lanthipeptide [uncultured Aquimarina sp.]|uniref:class I lanthipeptide n=1 Tax=uncultured Aquimarina sp. TaxID=575652 RepID=UPI00261B0309|nr:class I lanthipeptide [uncultured Aquimarina sp.]